MLINVAECLEAVLEGRGDEPVGKPKKERKTVTLDFIGQIPPHMNTILLVLEQYAEGLITEREAFATIADRAVDGWQTSPE